MRRTLCLLLASLLPLLLLGSPTSASTGGPPIARPLPKVMASTGDSITRAYNVGLCCVLQDTPERSWSTGSSSTVLSHYRRLLAFDPRIEGNVHNNAVSGARMSDLPRQMQLAVDQHADYVTVEMGANDLCRSSIGSMTSVEDFEAQLRSALSTFLDARPRARVLVASIPDLYRLWSLFHEDPLAQLVWTTFGICQSMLSPANTEADRQLVVAREEAFNDTLQVVCAEFTQCRWDDRAVFLTPYEPTDVSPIDYFHPSTAGQNRLAATTWAAGYWPTQ
jgi:lysophospholipase L1-like esterase